MIDNVTKFTNFITNFVTLWIFFDFRNASLPKFCDISSHNSMRYLKGSGNSNNIGSFSYFLNYQFVSIFLRARVQMYSMICSNARKYFFFNNWLVRILRYSNLLRHTCSPKLCKPCYASFQSSICVNTVTFIRFLWKRNRLYHPPF